MGYDEHVRQIRSYRKLTGEGVTLVQGEAVRVLEEVVDVGLRALRETGRSSAFAAVFWEQAGSLRVRRAEPVWNMGGKFAPLCVAERVKKAGGR